MGGTASAAHDELLATVRLLWPDDEVVLRTGRRASGPVATTPRTELVAVPRARSVRLLVPSRPAAAAAQAMLRFSTATPMRESVARLAAHVGLRAGGGRLLPDRIGVTGPGTGSVVAHLSEILGQPVVVSLGIGTARVNRKPVLEVFDTRGRSLAFVKVGASAVSRADVSAEAAALQRLSGRSWREFTVPEVLHFGTWRDAVVLVCSALPSAPELHPRAARRIPRAAMLELATAYAGPPVPLRELPWLTDQHRVLAGLSDDASRRRMEACLTTMVEQYGAVPVATGAWHGDWTPWNMSRRRGVLHVWDWERFEEQTPTGLDPCHYAVNLATRREGTRPDVIRAGLHAARAERHTAALYLLAALARYLPLVEVEHGERIAPRAQTYLTTLEEILSRP